MTHNNQNGKEEFFLDLGSNEYLCVEYTPTRKGGIYFLYMVRMFVEDGVEEPFNLTYNYGERRLENYEPEARRDILLAYSNRLKMHVRSAADIPESHRTRLTEILDIFEP